MTKKFFNQNIKKEVIIKKEEPEISIGVVIINLLLLTFIIFAGTKFYILYKYSIEEYKINHNNIVFNIKYNGGIEEISTKTYNTNDYTTFKNISLLNVFNDFNVTSSDNEIIYSLNDDVSLSIRIENNSINNLLENTEHKDISYIDLLFSISSDNQIATEYIIENDIENEVDFLNSLNEDFDTTILSSTEEIKLNYAKMHILKNFFEEGEINLLNGDYIGYKNLFESDGIKTTRYTLIEENTSYVFTIENSDYYTSNELKNIINSIIIK